MKLSWNRTDDGLLTYTRIFLNSDEQVHVTDGSGFAYGGIEELEENLLNDGTTKVNETVRTTAEVPTQSWQNDKRKRKYEQSRFDDNKLSYYMDDDGFLVVDILVTFITIIKMVQ